MTQIKETVVVNKRLTLSGIINMTTDIAIIVECAVCEINVMCLFSASFDHRKTLSALVKIANQRDPHYSL